MKQKGFAPILIIVLIALVGIGAYLLGAQNNKISITPIVSPQASINESTPPPLVLEPTPKLTINLTAGWKIYENREYGFSLIYPADYFKYIKVEDNSHSVYFAPKETQNNDWRFLGKTDLALDITTETPRDYYPFPPTTDVKIGGYKGLKYYYTFDTESFMWDAFIADPPSNLHYGITLRSRDENTLKQSEGLFDQIVASFQVKK